MSSVAAATPVLLPLAALLAVAAATIVTLARMERRVPLFDLGSMAALVVTLYGGLPLVNYLAGGLQWGANGEKRLRQYASTPAEIGAFAWRYVLCLVVLSAVYLWLRRRATPLSKPMRRPDRATFAAIAAIVVVLAILFRAASVWLSLDYVAPYESHPSGNGSLPLLAQQIAQHLFFIYLYERMLLLTVALAWWERRAVRIGVAVWLVAEAVLTLTRFTTRTPAFLLFFTFVLMYDRLVRPLRWRVVAAVLAASLCCALAYGYARSAHLSHTSAPNVFTATNEFQSVFATSFDLTQRARSGSLRVPPAIRFVDLLALVPSQLLRTRKIEPATWYITEVLKRPDGPGRAVGGPITESALGFGVAELALRAALLGAIYAAIHRWYAKRQERFWPTAFYLIMIASVYFTFRATTFVWINFIEYRFLPMAAGTMALAWLLRRYNAPGPSSSPAPCDPGT